MATVNLPRTAALLLVVSLATLGADAQAPTQRPAPAQPAFVRLQADVVAAHAAHCHSLYLAVEQKAKRLAQAIDALLAAPDETTLAAARRAWCEARVVYGKTEVLRFHDGPIEPIEPFLNAWPIDEAYIDAVVGHPTAGIVNDPVRYPSLGAAVLAIANERGGEANVSTGWHAIEFLLWGQDLSPDGPGRRPASDFVPGQAPMATRRGDYLRAVGRQLLTDLATVRAAWDPAHGAYRRSFVADADGAVRRMLTGAVVLTAFELAGERLTVAFETRDQEQEHSCFSDTTCADLVANQTGIADLVRGVASGTVQPPCLLDLVRLRSPEAAQRLEAALAAATAAVQAIPAPFDRAILGDDAAPGRRAIQQAILALEAQAEALLVVGRLFGHELPLQPGNR